MNFPIFKTKKDSGKTFNLSDPQGRKEYFEFKAGPEIIKLKEHLRENTFIVYLMGKKSSGKGTYAKMFAEAVGEDKIEHFSVGDMIRNIDKELQNENDKQDLISFLEKNYRGWHSIEEIIASLEGRSTKVLLPTALILSLIKREIAKREKRVIFIDGFPRDMDQISYSLFFRDLIDYRQDPDVFVLIDVPNAVIDERIKWRKICPSCNTSRSLKLLPTSKINYDKETREFSLICDAKGCEGFKMVSKEGDELGIEPIKERLETDEKLIKQAMNLYGIPKILLRNSVPVDEAENYVDNYELTPEYEYEWDEINNKVKIIEKPWTIKDNQGIDSYSLLAPPVVVSLIHQLVDVLNI